jgi:hypothetical protein
VGLWQLVVGLHLLLLCSGPGTHSRTWWHGYSLLCGVAAGLPAADVYVHACSFCVPCLYVIHASALMINLLLCCTHRDLAQFRAVAQELLSSAAWQLAGQAPPQQLAAAAAEAASPVEVEEVLQALLAHAAALTATLKAALQLLQDDEQQQSEVASRIAAAAGPEQLQAELQGLAERVAALRSAAAAARAPFGWEDGPLVVAMRRGQLLLVDELNLAEDAVLERLNRCDRVGHPNCLRMQHDLCIFSMHGTLKLLC